MACRIPHRGAGLPLLGLDRDAEVVVGDAPARVLAEARVWAAAHQAELAANWQELNR